VALITDAGEAELAHTGFVTIVLSDDPTMCSALADAAAYRGLTIHRFSITAFNPTNAEAGPGTYPVNFSDFFSSPASQTNPYAFATLDVGTFDDAGNGGFNDLFTFVAASGNITITGITSSEITGSYDLAIVDGGAVSLNDAGILSADAASAVPMSATFTVPVCVAIH
jgi:hypothetical protein